ncbi:hypothetical protein NQ176_g5759 [Zarea fungicola]|uniref:Uncharacterized protein n=1 Tax=Zarea fungicola TaxID=93591 RepID=A0ACC1N8Q9_9HYPO|nr:hypothetical protein NQ176_g5759 [Lecanicillium fungicola]
MPKLTELVAPVDEPQNAEKQSKAERAFVARLDLFLLTFGCISQVINFTTYFNVAYCVMLIPSQIIMTYVRPSWWLPSVEIIWGIITGLIAITHNAKQVYVLRAFLGLCESAAYPGMITLFSCYYQESRWKKRFGRWLFIVNAIITVFWGLAGYVMIPDMPNKPNPWAIWYKKVHSELALGRLARTNRVDAKPISWAGAKRTFTHWLVYIIGALYIAMVLGTSGADYFGLFLKSIHLADGSPRWKPTDINLIPIGGSAITVVFVWVWAFMSDFLRTRWLLIIVQALIAIMVGIIMSVWTTNPSGTPLSAAYAAFFMQRIALGTAPLIWSWLSDLSPTDPEGRTLIVGASIAVYYSISAWSQVLLWPASQAPHYQFGWQSAIGLCALVVTLCVVLRIIDVRFLAPKRKTEAEIAAIMAEDADDVEKAHKLEAEAHIIRVQSTA